MIKGSIAQTIRLGNIPRVPQQAQTGRSWGHSGSLSCPGFGSSSRKGKPAWRWEMSTCLSSPWGPEQAYRETVSTAGSHVATLCTVDKKCCVDQKCCVDNENAEVSRL